jgi:hypothetical protein
MKGPFQAVRIKSCGEFEWLIEHLTHEAFRVRDHWEFWGALDRSFDQHWEELNQTPNFWELTRRAHQDAVALRLGRLFDPHAAAISLGSLLQTMKENAVAPSPLLPAIASLDLSELDKDMSSVSGGDAKVRKSPCETSTWRTGVHDTLREARSHRSQFWNAMRSRRCWNARWRFSRGTGSVWDSGR